MPKDAARVYLFVFGLLDAIALATAFYYSINVIGEYFSYFTVLSNYLITFVFLSLALKKPKKNDLVSRLYGPAVLYMCITGVVFWTLLHGGRGHLQLIPWVNIVLHGIMPIVAFAAWILFPADTKHSYKSAFLWLAFPSLFALYTVSIGPLIHWYPYLILNPATAGGYPGVIKNVIEILIGAYIAGLILIRIAKR